MSGAPTEPNEPEAPRREFKFKATEFERTNRALDEADSKPPIDVQALYAAAGQAKKPAPVEPAMPPPPPALNDVHAILKANLQRANETGENDLVIKETPPSRRKRDYWTLMIATNLFFGLAMILAPGPATLAFGVAGMVLCSIGLTWVMWFIMDNY